MLVDCLLALIHVYTVMLLYEGAQRYVSVGNAPPKRATAALIVGALFYSIPASLMRGDRFLASLSDSRAI